MLGIWCLTVWQQLGQPGRLRLVELGPGRGTLMADLLRGVAPFKAFVQGAEVHMVEVRSVMLEAAVLSSSWPQWHWGHQWHCHYER